MKLARKYPIIKTHASSFGTTKRVAAVTAAVALLLLTGIPAASAQTGYLLCYSLSSGTVYCLEPSAHGSPAYLGAGQAILFINRYVTPNGNAWWELESEEYGQCLNWAPADPTGNDYLYWDSCQADDANELFYNHVAGQLINLAGNEINHVDSYLQPLCPATISTDLCSLTVSIPVFSQWEETLAP